MHATRRPSRFSTGDAGFTLIEVLVSLLVFAIIATGLVAAMNVIVQISADSRARIVATNLATQDLDVARAIGDPFNVKSAGPTTTLVGGRDYTLTRSVSWVSQAGGDVGCNSSTNLFQLRVNVKVTWAGQLKTTAPVQTDTLLAPAGRISDTSSGAIGIAVSGADGKPQSGVAVTVTPTTGGKELTVQPADTGADGCTYATQVAPGTYDVRIVKSGWVDPSQQEKPTQSIAVQAGATSSAGFQYDRAATYTTVYASNYKGSGGKGAEGKVGSFRSVVVLPDGLQATFVNSTSGLYVTRAVQNGSVLLHPFPDGYTAVAGELGTSTGVTRCAAFDPSAWTAGVSSNGVVLGTGVRPSAAAPPGGATTMSVPMGVVTVTVRDGMYLGAVSAGKVGNGNPGCESAPTYYFTAATTTGTSTTIALPFGAWTIYAGTSVANAAPVARANLAVRTNAAGDGVVSDGLVVLDPRPNA